MLLDRGADLAAADAVLERADRGERGRLLVIEGPPGIGKTELASAIRGRAMERDVDVLLATGGELETDVPFGVVRQLFVPTVLRGHRLQGRVSAAAALGVGEPHGIPDQRQAEASAFEALYGLCGELSAQRTMLLLVDDLHWADAASVKFLLFLARRLAEMRVGLVLTTRPAGVSGRSRELDLLLSLCDTRLALRPLTLDSTRSYLFEVLHQTPTPAFVRACHQATGGNPLLLRELLTEVQAAGLQPRDDAVGVVPELGSRNVAQAALSRVTRLGPASAAVAGAVAVLGQHTGLALVAEVAGVPVEDTELLLDDLVGAGILHDGRPLTFVHPMVRSAIYRHMPAGLRSRRHRIAARLLDASGGGDDEVFRHLVRTEPAGDAWVLDRLRRAGRRAVAAGAPDVAVTALTRAVAEDPNADAELLLELGQAAELTGGRSGLEHLQAAYARAGTPQVRVRVAVPLSRSLAFRRRWTDALAVLDDALATLPEDDGQIRLRLETERLWVIESGDLPEHDFVALAEQLAVGLTGQTPDERRALVHLGAARLFRTAPREEVRDIARRALADGLLLAEEGPDSPIWLYAAGLLWVVGDYQEADDELVRAQRLAQRQASTAGKVQTATMRAWIAFEVGDLPASEAHLRGLSDVRALGPRSVGGRYGRACLATVLTEQGRLDEAYDVLGDLGRDLSAGRGDRYDALLLHARGELRLAGGEADGLADLLAVGAWCEQHRIGSPAEWAWRTDVAPALAAAGDVDRAKTLLADEIQGARRAGVPRPLGRALHAAAMLEPVRERVPLLRAAVDVLAGSPARLAHAKALLHLGAALRAHGTGSEARTALREALSLADACGAAPLVATARSLLVASGARPRRTALVGPKALTPTEREVCRRAAGAMSNREIAEQLFVSVKAIEKHLGSSYAKLGITSRAGLAAALGEAVMGGEEGTKGRESSLLH